MFLKVFNSELPYIEKWFTDQSFKLIERERKINITSVINLSVTYKKITCISVEPGDRIFVKNINFRFLLKIWVKTQVKV